MPVKDIESLVALATKNFTIILATVVIKEHYPELHWGGNGVGDRWANKKFNYTSITSQKTAPFYSLNICSESENDTIPLNILNEFVKNAKGVGIIGIYVHSKRTNIQYRPISKTIYKLITNKSCVVCGTQKTICDHKNDLYNEPRVLKVDTQTLDDFQPLCNHCNLQKRQVCKKEHSTERLYSAKNITRYTIYPFEFPWEKKAFDKNDVNCKTDTYWYDPVEFDRRIYYYSSYTIPLLNELKNKFKLLKVTS